jgi:hypothetical protein
MLTDSLYSLVSRYHRHMDELILLHQEALLLQLSLAATDPESAGVG